MPPGPFGELVGLLIAIPFVLLGDWFKFIKQLPPGLQELAKASHGVGMVALALYWAVLAGGPASFIASGLQEPFNPVYSIPAVIGMWGLGWFFLNARIAALSIGPPHRATTVVRALIKIALGWAAWAYTADLDLSGGELVVHAVALWCLATGAAKILLILWGGGRGDAYPMVAHDIEANEFRWDDEVRR